MYKILSINCFILLFLLFLIRCGNAQVGINIIAPDPNAALHIYGNREKGLLIPFMGEADRAQFQTIHSNQSNGLMVYDTLLHLYYQFTGTAWQAINPWNTNRQGTEISKTTDGDVNINSTPANRNQFVGYGTTPVGGIIMWSGDVAQFDATGRGTGNMSGWALCDGRNSTPDLQGRFVAGYDRRTTGYPEHSGAEYHIMRNPGGERSHLLSSEECGVPPHDHPIDLNSQFDGSHQHSITAEATTDEGSGAITGGGDTDYNDATILTNFGTGTHSHRIFGNSNNNSQEDANLPHENRPPYLVLAYIMRIY